MKHQAKWTYRHKVTRSWHVTDAYTLLFVLIPQGIVDSYHQIPAQAYREAR